MAQNCYNFEDLHGIFLKPNPRNTDPIGSGNVNAWIYRDENRNDLLFEKQLTEDDISGDYLQIPKRMGLYLRESNCIVTREMKRNWELEYLACDDDNGKNDYRLTGRWKEYVNYHQLKPKDLVVMEISNDKRRIRIGYTSDQEPIDNLVLLRRLCRADVKVLYLGKLFPTKNPYDLMLKIDPLIDEKKLCFDDLVRKADGVKCKLQVGLNLNGEALPAVDSNTTTLSVRDPIGNSYFALNLVHSDEDDYYLGGDWGDYAEKYKLLEYDTIFLDKVTARVKQDGQSSTAPNFCHYEITYQRRGTKERAATTISTVGRKEDIFNSPLVVSRLTRGEVKDHFSKKMFELYFKETSNVGGLLIEIEQLLEIKLCSEDLDGVKLKLPTKQVEENLNDLPLPSVGGKSTLSVFDRLRDKILEMKLVRSRSELSVFDILREEILNMKKEDEYYIGGDSWKEYADDNNLLAFDTLYLDKVSVHNDELNSTAIHYEINYQRRCTREEDDLTHLLSNFKVRHDLS